MKNPNGFGTVTKLSGKRRKPWVVKVTAGFDDKTGRQIQKSIGTFATRAEAINHLSLYNVMKENEAVALEISSTKSKVINSKVKIKHTFRECAEAIIEKGREKKRSESWFKSRRCACNLLSEILDEDITKIDLFKLQRIFDNLRIQGKSKSTLSNCKIVCTSAFEYAVIHKWIERNDDYSKYIDITSTANRTVIHYPFSNKEIELIKRDDSLMAKVVLVYILTGCRASELLNNVKRYDTYIVCGIKTESGKNRKIPIHSYIEPFIDDVLAFLKTKKYKDFAYCFEKYMKHLDMEHTPHDTRNTFATLGKEFDMKQTAVKKIIGHKTNDLTEDVYTHESIEYLKKEIEKIKIS